MKAIVSKMGLTRRAHLTDFLRMTMPAIIAKIVITI